MLMPRAHYVNTIGSSGNTSFAVAMQQHQQEHIKQLLSTAAGGSGVVGDVDALLTPITTMAATVVVPPQAQSQQQPSPATAPPPPISAPLRLEPRPERNLWRTDEIMQMLSIMQQTNAIEQLNDKSVRSEKVFRNVEDLMHSCGYVKKSHVQIWTKWKFLKSTYTTSKRNGVVPKMIPQPVYETLHKMLAFGGGGSECGTSNTSLDGDNSNGGGTAGVRMLIAGAEGGGGQNSAPLEEDGGDGENVFGMAHPIFGFRLGLVKQEPIDAGYDPAGSTKSNGESFEHDSLTRSNTPASCPSTANIQFQTQIKQEIEDDSPETPSKQTEAHSMPKGLGANRAVFITPVQAAMSTTPTRMPTTAPTAIRRAESPKARAVGSMLLLPPLRIAPFAKAPCEDDDAPQTERSPPPLSKHAPASRATRGDQRDQMNSMPICISGKNKQLLHQRSALTKTAKAPMHAPVTTLHLPSAVTIQPAARLKHVGARRQPYAPRTISGADVEAPITSQPRHLHFRHLLQPQHQQLQESPLSLFPDVAMTSQQARMNAAIQKQLAPVAVMQKKGNKRRTVGGDGPSSKQARKHALDDGAIELNALFNSAASMQRQSFLQHNGAPTKTAPKPPPETKDYKPSRRAQEFFDSALKDLGTNMRQMQRELIADFFKQQMALAQREHEFQMQQDLLLMTAFEEQMKQIMSTARQLLGVDMANGRGTNGHADRGERNVGEDMMNAKQEATTSTTTKIDSQQHEEADEGKHHRHGVHQDYLQERGEQLVEDDSDSDSSSSSSDTDDGDSGDDEENGDDGGHYNGVDNGNDAKSADDDNTSDNTEEDDDYVANPIQLVTSELRGEN